MLASNILQYFMWALFSRLNISSVPSGVFSQSIVLVMEIVVATYMISSPSPIRDFTVMPIASNSGVQ